MIERLAAICVELAKIEGALSGRGVVFANQGQSLDGFSALAAFREIAARARSMLVEPQPADACWVVVCDGRECCGIDSIYLSKELAELALLRHLQDNSSAKVHLRAAKIQDFLPKSSAKLSGMGEGPSNDAA